MPSWTRNLVLAVLLVPALAVSQGSTPSKASRSSQPAVPASPQSGASSTIAHPSPSPTPPTPATPQLPIKSAPAFAEPKYSPAQLDFGTVDYKASSQRTFSFTAPSAGPVTLQIPNGGFLAVEVRRVPPSAPGGKAPSIQMQRPAPTKPVPVQINGSYLLYQWNFAAGEEMQLDVAFTPSTLNDASPGLRTGTMDWSGSGYQPWHFSIPMRGAVGGSVVQLNPQAGPSAQGKKPALNTPASPSSADQGTASALPTPAGPKGTTALALNAPTHSPDHLDFGEVWDGDMMRRTFHLTTTAAGYVTVQIPKGPFRVAEFREMGPVQTPSKNPGPGGKSPVNLGPIQPVKTRTAYQDGQAGPFQWSLAPDTDIQIDVAFQPHFNLMSEIAGQKSATMKVTGPGMHGNNWTVSVPLVGMFDGLKLSATMAPETKEILAIAGEKYAPLNVTLYGLDTPVTGTIRAGSQVPPGVSVISKTVKVGAKTTAAATVWLSLGSISDDRAPRPLELVFDDGNKTSKALFQFIGLPNSRHIFSGERPDCKLSHLRLSLVLHAPMHNQITGGSYIQRLEDTGDPGSLDFDFGVASPGYEARNPVLTDDSVFAVRVYMRAESGGVGLFEDKFNFYQESTEEIKQNVSEIRKKGTRGYLTRGTANWLNILDGNARFGCSLSGYMYNTIDVKYKWAPAAP